MMEAVVEPVPTINLKIGAITLEGLRKAGSLGSFQEYQDEQGRCVYLHADESGRSVLLGEIFGSSETVHVVSMDSDLADEVGLPFRR